MKKSELVHAEDVRVAVNEYITRQSVNRNIRKLLENDSRLDKLYTEAVSSVDVSEYKEGKTYRFGDTVWFKDRSDKLWLLQCVAEGNTVSPQKAIDSPNQWQAPDFQTYGWEDLNENADMTSLGLSALTYRLVQDKLESHEADRKNYHMLGRLDGANAAKKLMLRDMSNADMTRENYFFPYRTGHFTTDAITNGTYRVWDCGLIEFDIVFRLGYRGTDDSGYDILSCNDMKFGPSSAKSLESPDYNENTKYFNTLNDMKIFQNPDQVETFQSTIGNTKQGNRNGYVNTYFAKLDFFPKPIPFNGHQIDGFAGLDYMVFCGDTLSQDPDQSYLKVYPSANQMTWCGRTKTSVTAVYITFPNGVDDLEAFGQRGGLAANSFSCQVIGRWK